MDAGSRGATFDLDIDLVTECLTQWTDWLFVAALRDGLGTLPRSQRSGALAGVTGHVAESVAEVLLEDLGYVPIWHFTGPGRHGVDLLELHPETGVILAVEVKGTLRPGRWPRLSRGELQQMSAAWIDKADNPGMAEWDLRAEDIRGAVIRINFADRRWRAALTDDFETLVPVDDLDQLALPFA